MFRKPLYLLLALSVLLVIQGCATSTLTTAKTTPKGQVDLVASATFVPDANGNGFAPELTFRFGVAEKLDLGLRIFGLGFFGEAKLGLIQNETGFNLALHGGVGYSIFILPFYTYEIGAIISIDMEKIAPYASVKVRRLGVDTDGDSNDFLDNISGEFMTTAVGICLFPKSRVSLFGEFNWFQAIKVFGESVSGKSQAIFTGGIRLRVGSAN